jgi:hypothetical protein
MSFPPGTEMFQFPGFAPGRYGFAAGYPLAGVGCPIRRPPDQSPLAAPRGLSQRAASFVASRRQGIHQVPFSRSPRPSGRAARRVTGGPPAAGAGSRRHRTKHAAACSTTVAAALAARPPLFARRHHTITGNVERPRRRGGARAARGPASTSPGPEGNPNSLLDRPAAPSHHLPRGRRDGRAAGRGGREGMRGRRAPASMRSAGRPGRGPADGRLRKEVIQPQVPLRLPCYDFTPVADLTVDGCPPRGLAHRLRVKPTPMV